MVRTAAAAPFRPRPQPGERLRRGLLAAPLLAIGFAIWAFGGVYAWAFGTAYLIVAATLAVAAVAWGRGQMALDWQPTYAPALLVALWVAAQLLLGWSFSPAETLTAALHLGAAGAVYLIVSQCFRRRDAGWILAAGSAFTAALALLAIAQILTAASGIYWTFTYTYASPAGSFVNRNHFAGCMEMLLPLACVAAWLRRGERWQVFLPWAASPGLGLAAVVLAASRGGLAALALEALAGLGLVLYLARHREGGAAPPRPPVSRERRQRADAGWRQRRSTDPPPGSTGRARLVSLLIAAALTLGLVALVGTGRLEARLEGVNTHSPSVAERLDLDQSTLAMLRERPAVGWGLGTWAAIYPAFARFDSTAVYAFAHNDYLQWLAETGLVGGAGLLLFWAIWGAELAGELRRWPRTVVERGGESEAWRPLLAAAAVGCGGILAHSWLDFNLHIPANLMLFAALAALAHPSRADTSE